MYYHFFYVYDCQEINLLIKNNNNEEPCLLGTASCLSPDLLKFGFPRIPCLVGFIVIDENKRKHKSV